MAIRMASMQAEEDKEMEPEESLWFQAAVFFVWFQAAVFFGVVAFFTLLGGAFFYTKYMHQQCVESNVYRPAIEVVLICGSA